MKAELLLLLAQLYIVLLLGMCGASYIAKRLRAMRRPRSRAWMI